MKVRIHLGCRGRWREWRSPCRKLRLRSPLSFSSRGGTCEGGWNVIWTWISCDSSFRSWVMDNLGDKWISPWHPVPGNDGLPLKQIFNLVNKLLLLPAAAHANIQANIETNFEAIFKQIFDAITLTLWMRLKVCLVDDWLLAHYCYNFHTTATKGILRLQLAHYCCYWQTTGTTGMHATGSTGILLVELAY